MGITKHYLVPATIFDEFVSKVYTRGNKQVTAVLKNPLEKYSLKESRNNASKKRKASDKSGEEPKEKVTNRKTFKKPALSKQTGKNKKQKPESAQEDEQEENEQARSITAPIESSNLEKSQSSSGQSSESEFESNSSATSSESD